jgi:hypothetical protein
MPDVTREEFERFVLEKLAAIHAIFDRIELRNALDADLGCVTEDV